jgi:hypothetical protein
MLCRAANVLSTLQLTAALSLLNFIQHALILRIVSAQQAQPADLNDHLPAAGSDTGHRPVT